jgi:hypothetical protein
LTAKVRGELAGAGIPLVNAVVYMAQSISLAVLENLVHMSKVDFPVGYVTVSALIPDGLNILDHFHRYYR